MRTPPCPSSSRVVERGTYGAVCLSAKSNVKDSKTGVFKAVHLTNEELRHVMMPATGAHSVPYIYAHFKWKHCDEAGFEFPKVE